MYNKKLVICTVREGSLVSEGLPTHITDEWVEIPGTRETAGSYYQADYAARISEELIPHLPDNCHVDERFEHVTKLNLTHHMGQDVLEVCHQPNPVWFRIESFIY
jgi:hypothetical protein